MRARRASPRIKTTQTIKNQHLQAPDSPACTNHTSHKWVQSREQGWGNSRERRSSERETLEVAYAKLCLGPFQVCAPPYEPSYLERESDPRFPQRPAPDLE